MNDPSTSRASSLDLSTYIDQTILLKSSFHSDLFVVLVSFFFF